MSDVGAKGARSAPRFRDLSCGALAFDCIAGDYQNRTADCPQTASNSAPDPLTCSGDDGGTAGQRFEHRKLLPSLSPLGRVLAVLRLMTSSNLVALENSSHVIACLVWKRPFREKRGRLCPSNT